MPRTPEPAARGSLALANGRRRLRSGLRRHGLVPRPTAVVEVLREARVRTTAHNRLSVHDWGSDGLEAMLAAIRAARSHIHLETYILRDDATGRRFVDALSERARAGVAVRLLYDAVGSLGLDPVFLAPLEQGGGQTLAFNPLSRLVSRFLPRRRDHRKILVVDGERAFVGGLNIGDEYAAIGDRPAWRDTHVCVEGPAVRDLEAVFLESWFRADGSELDWLGLLEGRVPEAGGEQVAVLPDGPTYRRRRMRDLVIEGLDSARHTVRFASPYFAPGRPLLDALVAAANRGVRVQLLVAGDPSDHPWIRRGSHGLYPRLLRAGLEVFEYQQAMMHAKVAIFDDSWAVLGTSNLDRQSFRHSYEVNLVVEGAVTPACLVESFDRDLETAIRIDQPALARRGPWDRLLDYLAGVTLRLI